MAGRGSGGSARRAGAVRGSGSPLFQLLLLLLCQGVGHGQTRWGRDVIASTEVPVGSIDPAALDLAPLVNTLINSTQSGSLQLFSLLSVTSYSSLELHKLTLLIYNISSVSLESEMFQRKFCYCVSNKTNDLTDFTAILLDVMSNSSYLHEIFKSTSILSVSQRNDTDCIYICVMAGQTDRELPQLWDSALITPLFNQTIIEDPHRSVNVSLHHSSTDVLWGTVRDFDGPRDTPTSRPSPQTPPPAPPPAPPPTPPTPPAPPPPPPPPPTPPTPTPGDAAPSPPSPAARPPPSLLTHRPTGETTAAAVGPPGTAAGPGAPVSMTTTTLPTPAPRGGTPTTAARPPPTPAAGAPIGTERPTLAPPPSAAVTSSAITVRPGQLTTGQKTTTTTGKTTNAPTTTPRVQSGVQEAPQGATHHPAVVVQQEVTSSPWRTSGVNLLPVRVPLDSAITPTIAGAAEKPGCPWRRASDRLSSTPGARGGPWTTLGAHKLQPCLLELCKFFSQCLCRPNHPRSPQRRYCVDGDLWYHQHTSELCGRLKRVSFSRNLKQRCLAKMCGRP